MSSPSAPTSSPYGVSGLPPMRLAAVRALPQRFPTTWRLFLTVALTVLAILITFMLNPVQNSKLAGGGAIAIAVVGLTWLTGWSGQVSIGNSAFVMVGAYGAAIYDQHHLGTSMWIPVVSLVVATAVGAVAGLIIGIPGTRLRGPYLAGMTIAFAATLPSIITAMTSLTGGSGGIVVNGLTPPQWFTNLFTDSTAYLEAGQQWQTDFIIVFAGISFFFMSNLFKSKTGREMRLVRDNDVAAELAGVNLPRARASAFVVSAAYGGLCGGLLTLVNLGVNPNYFPFTLSITLLTMMVLGGIGTLSGALIGGLIYAFSGTVVAWINSATGISATSNLGLNMNLIIFGLLLILTMILAPAGIAGTFLKFRAGRRQRRLAKRATAAAANEPEPEHSAS